VKVEGKVEFQCLMLIQMLSCYLQLLLWRFLCNFIDRSPSSSFHLLLILVVNDGGVSIVF
jgi:hypothetical protein